MFANGFVHNFSSVPCCFQNRNLAPTHHQFRSPNSVLKLKKQTLLPNTQFKISRSQKPRSNFVVFAEQSNLSKVLQNAWRVGKDGIDAGTNLVPNSVPRPIARISVTFVALSALLFVFKSLLSTAFFILMAAVERLSMYARDREYAAAVMDIKVVGNAGPDIDNKVRKDLINMRTFHLEYDVCSRKGRLPAAFARGFGVQVAPFVMLRDPNFNEFEVAIAKKNGKVYFTDGWGVLKSFYGIVGGGWVTVVYSNRHLFLMELRNLHGEEVAYPVTNPPAKLMLQNQNAIDYRMSFVPYGPAGRFLPTTFHHTVEKVLTDSDATTGVLKLGWLGFCRDALPADKTDLTLIDYLGYTWKLMMDFAHDDQLSCVFSGEWQAVCNARKLVEGVKIKIGVTEEAGNKVLYLCGPQMMVLRTSVPPSKSIGRQGPSYRLDHYFWKN